MSVTVALTFDRLTLKSTQVVFVVPKVHKSCKSGEISPISSLYDMCKHVYDTRCMHGESENRMSLDTILTAHCKYGPDPSPFRQN